MALPIDRLTARLNWFKTFACETLTSFGLVTILKAVMVPPALSIFVR